MTGWTDVTSYSQGERRGGKEQDAWEARMVPLRVTVHRYHGTDGWFVTCHEISIARFQLQATDPAEARKEALEVVRNKVAHCMSAIESITRGVKEPT